MVGTIVINIIIATCGNILKHSYCAENNEKIQDELNYSNHRINVISTEQNLGELLSLDPI